MDKNMKSCESFEKIVFDDEIFCVSERPSFRRRNDLAFYCYKSGLSSPLVGLKESSLELFSKRRTFVVLTEFYYLLAI